jgi:SAM-dependent methyltransferase
MDNLRKVSAVYYQVEYEEEITQVNRAVEYYLDWAEEFRTSSYEWDFIVQYYRGLLDPTQILKLRFRALFFAMRLQPVLSYITQFIKEKGQAPVILDLGCGFGLETTLLALAGAKVHGVDGWRPMIETAEKRLASYKQRHSIDLDLKFQYVNLFQFSPSQTYDAVYSSATLHHIEPVADGFKKIAELMKPGAFFFLSDENGYSPVQQLAVQRKIGWVKPRKYLRIDPDTGQEYMYGNENIRAPYQWANHMRRVGLRPTAIKYCRFLPPINWSIERLVRAERTLRTIPLAAQLGAIGFLFIAQKETN